MKPQAKVTPDKKKISNRIVIESVPENLKQTLINIAGNKGVDLSSYLKPHLRELADKEPEHLKRAVTKD